MLFVVFDSIGYQLIQHIDKPLFITEDKDIHRILDLNFKALVNQKIGSIFHSALNGFFQFYFHNAAIPCRHPGFGGAQHHMQLTLHFLQLLLHILLQGGIGISLIHHSQGSQRQLYFMRPAGYVVLQLLLLHIMLLLFPEVFLLIMCKHRLQFSGIIQLLTQYIGGCLHRVLPTFCLF